MNFLPTPIEGAWLILPEPVHDDRGFFARTVCMDEFSQHGLNGHFVQQSVSRNTRAGILRGMHFQSGEAAEEKLVRVTAGAVHDVIVDLRPASATYLRWHATTLSADGQQALYIPRGVAHGFQTLTALSEVFYQMTVPYAPQHSAGVRWDDPDLAIVWPDCGERLISPRDRLLPTWRELASR